VRGFSGQDESSLEVLVINDVSFAALSADNPVARFCVDESKICRDCLWLSALQGVHNHRSRNAIYTHDDLRLAKEPSLDTLDHLRHKKSALEA
jgi:hypothetical protein